MPELSAVTTLELNLSLPSPLPLPDDVVDKAASLPSLVSLSPRLPANYAPERYRELPALLDATAALQRRLPHCTVASGDGFWELSLERIPFSELDAFPA